MIMFKFHATQIFCKFLPPLFSCYLRTLIYPFKKAINGDVNYTRQAVTGSIFIGNTKSFHGYCFGIHGFYDWRNILIARVIIKKEYSEIIEIGANIGTETIGFADIVGKNGKVHAFEPLPFALKGLDKVRENNSHLNIQVYPVALGETKTVADFMIPPENYSGVGRIKNDHINKSEQFIKVHVHKLDQYINNFKSVEAIFIDTEGHEPFVLSGAKETIQKFRPVVVLELSDSLLAENSKTSMDIFLFFEGFNYDCYNIGRFFITKVKKKSVRKLHRHTNWICLPCQNSSLIYPIKKLLYKHILTPLVKL